MWLAATGLAIAVLASLAVGLIWGLGWIVRALAPVLWPLAIAGVLAYLLDPVVDFFEKRKLPRSRAILLVFALALLILAGLFGSVVPQIVGESRQLIARVPVYISQGEVGIKEWIEHPPAVVQRFLARNTATPQAPDGAVEKPSAVGDTNAVVSAALPGPSSGGLQDSLNRETLQSATTWAAAALPKAGSWLFGQVGRVAAWFGLLAGLALVPVYLFYFLLEKQGISSRWTDYLPVADSRFKSELVFVLNSINNYLIAFFRGQVLVAICDAVLYTAGFLIIGLPYAVLIGAAAIVLTMIPFLGAMVTCGAALAIAVVQYGDWLHPLLVLVVFGIVQALEGLVISPKIMGDRVGLHPLTIIIAVMAGTTLLGGLLGGILAIPLTAALRVMMFRYIWKSRAPAK